MATSLPQRVPLSDDELWQQLNEQLQFLRVDCQAFDEGNESHGKRIAATLRILLHHHRNQRALLAQLAVSDTIGFVDSGAMRPDEMPASRQRMLMIKAGDPPCYQPVMLLDPFPHWRRLLPFDQWWNAPAIEDGFNHRFSRRDLVRNIAETDGGVHVDPELTPEYHALSRKQSMVIRNESPWLVENIAGQAGLALMRQVAHEVLCTLHEQLPDLQGRAEPVLGLIRYERIHQPD